MVHRIESLSEVKKYAYVNFALMLENHASVTLSSDVKVLCISKDAC